MDTEITPSRIIRDRWGYLQSPELEALKKCIDSLPDGAICINIGAGFGTSGLAFIESKNVARLYTIDKFALESENGLGALEIEKRVFKEFGYDEDPRYYPVHRDSYSAGITWSAMYEYIGEVVDMVFIDGDHSYEQVKKDIGAWLPNIKKGGIIAFHDYGPVDGLGGVSSAVDELITPKFEKISHEKAFAAFRIT